MTIRLYFDEDSMQQALVEALRIRAIDVSTALEAGMIERPDRDHLQYATSQGRVLYTFNIGDSYRLDSDFLTSGRPHSGMILARQQNYSVGEQMRRLLKLMADRSADEMQNHVEFLSAWD